MLATSACAVGRGGDKSDQALPDHLAEPAQPLQVTGETTVTTTGAGGGAATTTTVRGAPGGATATTAAPGGGGTTTTTLPFTTRLDLADRTGDAGLQAQPHGDATRVRMEDDGIRGRFTVELAAAIPAPLPPDEQLRVGIDLDQGGDIESEFQLFAMGNSESWNAWRHDNKKFVEYAGTFEVGANRLVFTVPWSALGGRKAGKLDVFVEWEKAGVVLAEESRDLVPDRGQASYQL